MQTTFSQTATGVARARARETIEQRGLAGESTGSREWGMRSGFSSRGDERDDLQAEVLDQPHALLVRREQLGDSRRCPASNVTRRNDGGNCLAYLLNGHHAPRLP